MPNRILRDYTDSEKIDTLSPQAENCFSRLIMKADDFGKFHGHPTLLKSALFPLKVDKITDKQMDVWIEELSRAKLIVRYEVNGKQYLKINDFGQRLRLMQSKFPDPPENDRRMTAECPHNDRTMTARNEVETKRSRNEVEVEGTSDHQFEIFWNLYDKKKGKEKALKLWNKLSQVEKGIILETLPLYVKSTPEVQFRKDPSTYLNNRSWEDQIIPCKQKQSNSISNPTGRARRYADPLTRPTNAN